jgi:diaminopimelate epimerase
MIDFVKTHALGNDFILVKDSAIQPAAYSELAKEICHRNFGVGADGVIYWNRRVDGFDLRIFNRDGSEAELSGNGVRCAAAWFMQAGLWTAAEIPLKTISGVYTLRRAGTEYETDMGLPSLRPEEIPFKAGRPMEKVIDHPLKVNGSEVRVSLCATGNPHCSLFVDELDDNLVNTLGPKLERHPAFPNRTNVEFIKVLGDADIQVAFWERGVGVSYASGTGSCGAAVASILNKKTGRRVTVHSLAGTLTVEWPEGGRLKLTAPATIVAEGRYYES